MSQSLDRTAPPAGFRTSRAVWQVVLIISILLLGIIIWQAIRFSTTSPAVASTRPTVTSQPISGTATQPTFDELNNKFQSSLERSRQASRELQTQSETANARSKAFLWWLSAAGLLIHIVNVTRIIRKLAPKRRSGYEPGNPIARAT